MGIGNGTKSGTKLMPRLKGSGKGWLSIQDGIWIGRWREYPKGIPKIIQKVLGSTEQVTREQARDILRLHIANLAIVDIGTGKTCHGLAVFKTGSLADRQAALNRGAMGELVIVTDLLSRGFEVFRSMSHSSSCDLIALWRGAFYRIEVKVADYGANGKPRLTKALRHGFFDVLAVVSKDFSEVSYVGLPAAAERAVSA
jgi:hypothetical protein